MPPSLTTLRQLLDWRAYPDILLLAVAVYVLYRTLRTMGTWKIALGVVVAGVGFLLASLMDLRGVEWIFSNVSQIILVALIVVFQPEIRRILERAAQLRGRRLAQNAADLPHLIDETLFALAQRGWGALIVLPGQDPILQWISEGVRADAVPSFPLLLSLFDPTSPGHDGAVVIDGGKLTRFAVRLPLSSSGALSSEFGTRHHAALGASEATDSLVLVVSEERRVVSMFHQGEMVVVTEKGEIARRVIEHWESSRPAWVTVKRSGRRWVPGLEIAASLLVAAVFWTTVVLSRTELREMFFTVPIEYASPRENVVLSGKQPLEARVHVSGPSTRLQSLDLSDIRVRVDLSEATPGRQTIPLGEGNVRVPRKLRLLGVEPELLDLDLHAVNARLLSIKPQLVGMVPEGVQLVAVEVAPPAVRALIPDAAEGDGSLSLMTTPIYLQSIRENTNVLCKVVAPPGVQPMDKRWADVEVRITVEGPREVP